MHARYGTRALACYHFTVFRLTEGIQMVGNSGRSALLAVAMALTGCVTHAEWKAEGVRPGQRDNPNVKVTSVVDVLTTTGLAPAIVLDVRPEPNLPTAFERSIEKYVDHGEFRIITASLEVHTMLSKQTVILDMLVETEGRSYRARVTKETDHAGFKGNKFLDEMPEYLDSAAKQIVDQLPHKAGSKSG